MRSERPAGALKMSRVAGFIVWTFVANGLIAWLFEFPPYGRLITGSAKFFSVDSYLLLWGIFITTIFLWVPFWAMAILCARRRAHGLEAAISTAAAVLLSGWLALDAQVFRATGNHLSEYLVQTNREAVEFAGGTGWMVAYLVRWFPPFVCIVVATLAFSRWLAPRLVPGEKRKVLRGVLFGAAIFVVVALLAPTVMLPRRGNLWRRFEEALPMELGWLKANRGISQAHSFAGDFEREAERTLFPATATESLVLRAPDETFAFTDPARRHVVLIVLESLRASALTQDWMPALTERANKGLRFTRHFSGGNNSTSCLFELLYARTAATFNLTLNEHILPTATSIFQNNGYGVSYVATLDDVHRLRGQDFLNHRAFPRLELSTESSLRFQEMQWVERDQWSIERVRDILQHAGDRPQFVVLFLGSSHHPYLYPPKFERFKPVLPEDWSIVDSQPRDALVNRYANSVGFVDAEVDSLLASLDLNRTIVAVVGDHGEGLLDDGTISHASRLSSAQTRVPMFICGAGVNPGVIDSLTSHTDVLPTLLHLIGGRPVHLPGVNGVDILDSTQMPRAEVLLATPVHGMTSATIYELGVVRDEGRIALTLNWSDRTVRVRGLLDEQGRVNEATLPDVSAAARWSRGFVQELQRLSQ